MLHLLAAHSASTVNATRCLVLNLCAIALLSGCGRAVEPPGDVVARTPSSIEIDGANWNRLSGDLPDDPRLQRVFRERKELAESPDLGGTLVAYASPSADRVRFFWIQAWSGSDAWTWVETDRDGKYLASGQAAGTRFPDS